MLTSTGYATAAQVPATAKKRNSKSCSCAPCGAATSSMYSRSTRAEALIQHVTLQPSFRAWDANRNDGSAPAASPKNVSCYLEARVAEVAAQLGSLQHAGDYTRLVVLLTELLNGDMAVGITPRMIEGGVLDLLRATSAAVAQGEKGNDPAAELHFSCSLNSSALPAPDSTLHSALQRTQGGLGEVAAAPIESLLPPLIDQTIRRATSADGAAATAGSGKLNTEEAEMEAWENYVATVRMATTADVVLPYDATAAADGTALQLEGGAAMPVSPVSPARIDSLSSALCALITRCTSDPFVCLTLLDQQREKPAVADLARVLLEMAKARSSASAAVSEVRLPAIQGLFQLLSTYVTERNTGGTAASGAHARTWRSTKPSSTAPEVAVAPTTISSSSTPAVALPTTQILEMMDDISLEWAQLLLRLRKEEKPSAHTHDGRLADQKADGSDEEDNLPGGAATTMACDGPAGELYWTLEIVSLLLQAQQRATQHGSSETGPRSLRQPQSPQLTDRVLPHTLIPVTLRTLSMLPNTPCLSSRGTMYARLCVDVLWTASLLAPTFASRQLLYGCLPESLASAGNDNDNDGDREEELRTSPTVHEENNAPAVDFFLALLHQFNETHSLAHRELRDDLVTLLALLLRHDVGFTVGVLTARRAAAAAADADAATPLTADQWNADDDDETLHVNSDTATTAMADAQTPLSLKVATVEAINAAVALMFETTCGAELSSSNSGRAGRTLADNEEVRPSALLSEDAVRSYALRFQSVSISAARRREVVEFKKYGWQLLEVHFCWQLTHLTFREYINLHDTAVVATAATAAAPLPSSAAAGGSAEKLQQAQRRHCCQRSPLVPRVADEDAGEDAVTTALWGMQLCRLGYFDVLLLYVDLDSTVPAVVTWTREELMLLEEEAWQLFTSMILFTQHLDVAAGGISVRRRRCYGPSLNSSPRGAAEQHSSASNSNSNNNNNGSGVHVDGVSSASLGAASTSAGEDGFDDDDDDEGAGVLYGADMHFIAAGGVEVALHFLRAAPPEMEAVKRSALVTLAAIARTSSSGDAHLHSGSYTTKEVVLVHHALTHHAATLVPFLVKIIREVNSHVDDAGVPAAGPPLISSVASAAAVATTSITTPTASSMPAGNESLPMEEVGPNSSAHTAARWGWLPQSANLTVVFAWYLLRCIGDVVLTEVGMMRELPDLMMNSAANEQTHCAQEEEVVDDDDEASSVEGRAHTAKNSPTADARHSGSTPPYSGMTDGQSSAYGATIEIEMADNLSSSGSSMGPPPDGEAEVIDEAASKGGRGGNGCCSDALAAVPSVKPVSGSTSTTPNTTEPQQPQQVGGSLENTATRRCTLLRSIHEEVLLIPEFFANEGGVGLLTTWIRHTLHLCLSDRVESSSWTPSSRQQLQQQQRTPILRLPVEKVEELDRSSDFFLLLLDTFRAIVLGSEGNEQLFVRSGGVHALLDLIEAFALARGLMEHAAYHARFLAVDVDAAALLSSFQAATTSTAASVVTAPEQKEKKDVLLYAMTLLSDLLDNCPYALDEFATWHSNHLFISPLTPDVLECWSVNKGIEAVQLLLCLWAADLPARNSAFESGSVNGNATLAQPPSNAGLELLRLHLRPALRVALKEEYVCRLLRRRAKAGALEAETIRCYYRYIHAESRTATARDEVKDAVVLAYMERLLTRHRKRNAIAPEQRIALLVGETLGLCLKVYGCLAAVGFDSMRAVETETATSPSSHTHLSALERSLLIEIAALPALCEDEVSTAMAEVALEHEGTTTGTDDAAAWRPTTPDRSTLRSAAAEAATRAEELDQIIEVGAQVQQARGAQLYHRYLVTQLRQPVAPPADGRPGAVRGAWKTQRRLSTTIGGTPVAERAAAAAVTGTTHERSGDSAVELAARLSTRLAAEEQQHQQRIASTVCEKNGLRASQVVGGQAEENGARLMRTAPPALGSSRTPYTALLNSVQAAAADRQSSTPFCVSSPPLRPSPPLTERHQKRQEMIARSMRKFPDDTAAMKNGKEL